ncbi:MAG: FKBP-type peptidyl-prolyl cis-trans isomerase [Armatimonadetes bacterium]|nr:FKBP-type peptidyl-prolyl cis-trans isomerase [Armatimonadota bacterium]
MKRLPLLALALVTFGCNQPKTFGDAAQDTATRLAAKAVPPDESIPVPPVEACVGPPEPDLQLVARRSAGITELKIVDLVLGDGPEIELEKYATVNYCAMLPDGSDPDDIGGFVFATNMRPGEPRKRFKLGTEGFMTDIVEVLPRWLSGMRVGGKRRLIIPASQAYGPEPPPGVRVPPNTAIVVDVHLLFVGSLP